MEHRIGHEYCKGQGGPGPECTEWSRECWCFKLLGAEIKKKVINEISYFITNPDKDNIDYQEPWQGLYWLSRTLTRTIMIGKNPDKDNIDLLQQQDDKM